MTRFGPTARAWAKWIWARLSTGRRAFCAMNWPATPFTASGQSRTFSGFVADTNIPFRVTVAWTDAPGSTTGGAYNNDLDLTVTRRRPNLSGQRFQRRLVRPRRSADMANNVESVLLPPGVAGNFTVTVAATSINSDWRSNNAERR